MYVNQGTLKSNDRSGATFVDMNPSFGEFHTRFAQ
jgi:hypothetical protein